MKPLATAVLVLALFGLRATAAECPADENYVKESILEPAAKVLTGFQPVMPTFKGQLNDYKVRCLITYMRSKAQ